MRRYITLCFFLLLPATSVLLSGCSSENLEDLAGTPVVTPCDTTAVATYSAVIKPIIQTNCLRCHGPGGIGTTSSGYQLDTYTGLKRAVDVRVGSTSLLVGVTDHLPGFDLMPKDIQPAKIPACDIVAIKRWVRRGAPND